MWEIKSAKEIYFEGIDNTISVVLPVIFPITPKNSMSFRCESVDSGKKNEL